MDVLFSPHNDDETLFAAYTCMRYKPRVIVCLRSYVEASWDPPVDFYTREEETAAACRIFGCEYEQWLYRDDDPDWPHIRHTMLAYAYAHPIERVWAPLPEPGGHRHHNPIGEIVAQVFPHTEFYATYTDKGKSTTGEPVLPQVGWLHNKLDAMQCYTSQRTHPATQAAFNLWPLDEYLTSTR